MLDFNQNFANWSKAMTAPFAELYNINSRISEQFTKDYVEMASSSMANAIKHVQTSLKTKDAEDFVRLQMDYVTDMSSKCLGFGKDLCDGLKNAVKDYRKWSEENTANVLNTDCCKKSTKSS